MNKPTNIADDKVKNLIIQILSEDWPITAKKLYYKIKRTGKRVTYQAVFKALQHLVSQGIVEKDKYNYLLNKKWLSETANFYEDVKESYLEEKKNFASLILKNQSITFTFTTLYKEMTAIAESSIKLRFLSKKEGYVGYAKFSQLPWPFAIGEKESELFRKMLTGLNKIYILCGNKNSANKLIYKYYKSVNKNVYLKFDKNIAQDHDTLILKNIVAQMFYEKNFKKSLDKVYANLENFHQSNLNELYKNLFLKKTKITAVVTRNPELAKIQKKDILRKFGKKEG
ncbi:hypothetical protein A3K73_00775 [Candidatus Pacearchaeota archaeon RBG_13_36_9]|nr:MAG: hypothetical protein A3K73_00775 [Candidatus Pacearchaeota archaeon RBG_13_36_9]